MATPIRVVVVDDSAFARKVLRATLSASSEIEVVAVARDGLEALEVINELKPDVVTLDLVMPNLDGLGVLRALPKVNPPRVVIVSIADGDSELGVAALQAGAVDLVHKPTALATDQLYELADELVAKVIAASTAHPLTSLNESRPIRVAMVAPDETSKRILLIGASTGGPQALTCLLKSFPADYPVPIAIVVHMPVGYTEAFARRLDGDCAIEVVEASEGLLLRPGLAVIARAGVHLKIARLAGTFRARLDTAPFGLPHCPAVNVLFESLAEGSASDVLAVVMTGMGDDGLLGSRALVKAGGAVIAEAESSCVVYGMPRTVKEAGLAVAEAPLEDMANTISRYL